MKKNKFLISSSVIVISLMLIGCGSDESSNSSEMIDSSGESGKTIEDTTIENSDTSSEKTINLWQSPNRTIEPNQLYSFVYWYNNDSTYDDPTYFSYLDSRYITASIEVENTENKICTLYITDSRIENTSFLYDQTFNLTVNSDIYSLPAGQSLPGIPVAEYSQYFTLQVNMYNDSYMKLHVECSNDSNTTNSSSTIENTDLTTSTSNSDFTYDTIISPTTGKVWMDRNLGSKVVCTAKNHTACYGDYYQWGRNADGHEKSDSNTTKTLSDSINVNHGNFISGSTDWTTTDSSGLERSTNWNPCPSGFRVPTSSELKNEKIENGDDAYSNLKLPYSGARFSHNELALVTNQNSYGYIWSSDTDEYGSVQLSYSVRFDFLMGMKPSNSLPVRCIKE